MFFDFMRADVINSIQCVKVFGTEMLAQRN